VGYLPLRSFIVGVGPPFTSADFRGGRPAAKMLGIGTGTVQRVVMEQPRPFDVGAAEAGWRCPPNLERGHEITGLCLRAELSGPRLLPLLRNGRAPSHSGKKRDRLSGSPRPMVSEARWR
jgi:hypothetical protein